MMRRQTYRWQDTVCFTEKLWFTEMSPSLQAASITDWCSSLSTHTLLWCLPGSVFANVCEVCVCVWSVCTYGHLTSSQHSSQAKFRASLSCNKRTFYWSSTAGWLLTPNFFECGCQNLIFCSNIQGNQSNHFYVKKLNEKKSAITTASYTTVHPP